MTIASPTVDVSRTLVFGEEKGAEDDAYVQWVVEEGNGTGKRQSMYVTLFESEYLLFGRLARC